jgi:predicted nicotinamide N-methyase
VLEIGSGIGLVGLAALACGWDVTFSDYDEMSLLLCRHNAERNGFPGAKTLRLDWRHPTGPKFPVVLGCEVIYEAKLHEPVLDVIQALLAPGGCCWLADPGRSQAPRFYERAVARGFRITVRDEAGRARPMAAPGEFQVFELSAS